ncbi:hypothetical protein GCM10022237_00340 [Nocardioides ginsengisoli]|uniref:Restriction endonuclease subunit S n=1 Tax=Nocardioides ginsengisoli TaxID=363868 RepID=A0ABW3W0Z6_9ACTN
MTAVGDLLVEFKEKPGKGDEPPILTLTERNGFVRQADRFNKRLATEDVSNYKVVRRNDIAFNPYLLWAGAVAQNTIVDKGIISPLYPTFRVRDDHDPRYVARLLLTPQLISAYDSIAFGSVPRRRRSSVNDFLALPLAKVPPLPEQRRIAAILDHADALRAKRRQVLTHLDALTQVVFHDMFGDLRGGRWDRVPFGELIPRVDNGTSPNCEARPAGSDEWAVLKLGAVTYGHFRPEENKAYLGDLGSMASNEVRSGDVLMTRKNTRELVGAVALVDEVRPQLLLPDLIFRLHLDGARLNRRYFQALMMNPQKRPAVRDLSSGSASSMPNISKARLAKLPLELPPLALQREFAVRVELIGGQRARVEAASAVDDTLFASLQTRAFRGDL